MPYRLIDTITLDSRKRRQIKSTGHNGMNTAKIQASRKKAVEKEQFAPYNDGRGR